MPYQCNDESNRIPTNSKVILGSTTHGRHDICGQEGRLGNEWFDFDFFEFKVEYGKTYLIYSSLSTLNFFDERQRIPNRRFSEYIGTTGRREGDHLFRFVAPRSGSFFLRIYTSEAFGQNYTLSYREIDDDNINRNGPRIRLNEGILKLAELETDDDTDDFKTDWLLAGRTYVFDLLGESTQHGTLTDGKLELFSASGALLAENDNGGTGTNARLVYRPLRSMHATLRTSGTAAGTFRVLYYKSDQIAADVTTHAELDFDGKHYARKTGTLSSYGDRDWFRVELNEGETYFLRMNALDGGPRLTSPSLRVRDAQGEVIASYQSNTPNLRGYFHAETSGLHYLDTGTADAAGFGDYGVSINRGIRTPLSFIKQNGYDKPNGRILVVDGAEQTLADFIDNLSLAHTDYEIYSSTPLEADGESKAANTLHQVSGDQFGDWKIPAGFRGRENIYLRAKLGEVWSQWLSMPVVSVNNNRQLISGSSWELKSNEVLTYRLVGEIPSYYNAGEITGFQSVSGSQLKQRIQNGLSQWYEASNLRFREAWDDVEADVNIFIANVASGEFVKGYQPGPERGGDIILNRTHYAPNSKFELGSREYFELLTGIGESIGLKRTTNSNRAKTVMSPNAHRRMSNSIYPITIGPTDLTALESIYRNVNGIGESTTFNFRPSTTGILGSFGAVTGYLPLWGGEELPVRVDLRDGRMSYALKDGVRIHSLTTQYGRFGIGARGTRFNDVLRGNHVDNYLEGNAGNDDLHGHQGDDQLAGGQGNDRYFYNFGDGHDTIVDGDRFAFDNKTDVLNVKGHGMFNITKLDEHFRFRKIEDDLVMDLTFNRGRKEGSIRIKDMAHRGNQVEVLSLFHDDNLVHRISLFQLYSQLSDTPTRFQVTAETDQFGSLVVPV